jgi:phytoene dehydrogenase-like protein
MSTSEHVVESAAYDVVFVGAGHNALVAAAYLTKAGRSVCLLDQGPVPGGWVRSEELTLPGFVHDTFSAPHPSFVFGPVLAELGAEPAGHGLEYVQGEVGMAASFADGRSSVVGTDGDALAAELGRLGEQDAWNTLMADLGPSLESLFPRGSARRRSGTHTDAAASRSTWRCPRGRASPIPGSTRAAACTCCAASTTCSPRSGRPRTGTCPRTR